MDFAQSCILVASLLAATSLKGCRLIALVMLLNFVVHDVTAKYVLEILNGAPSWPLHALNILISGATIFALVKLGANRLLYSAIFTYAIYNYSVICEFIISPVGFHANYIPFARIQMIIELIFMALIGYSGNYVYKIFRPRSNYSDFVSRVFTNRIRLGSQGVAR